MFDGLEDFGVGASWGADESLRIPTDPSAVRTATRWDVAGQAVRIHAGLEDIDDLIWDLDKSFAEVEKNRNKEAVPA